MSIKDYLSPIKEKTTYSLNETMANNFPEHYEKVSFWFNDYLNHYTKTFMLGVVMGENKSFQQELVSLLNLYNKGIVSQFFVDSNLVELTKNVFSDPVLRDFVLDGSVRFKLFCNAIDSTFHSDLIDVIADSQSSAILNESNVEASLLPENIRGLFDIPSDEINLVLDNNPWLVFIYLFRVYFSEVNAFKQILEAGTKD